jgi:hypothetical protein
MNEPSNPPYIEEIDRRGDIRVWTVDGIYIRLNLDKEFTNYGQHYRFSFIPLNEVWIDRTAGEDDSQFIIDHMLIEHRLMAAGVPYEKALARAEKEEQKERRRAGVINKSDHQKQRLSGGEEVHLRLWKKLESGVRIWIVNGRFVKSIFDIEFIAGGHEYIYDFIPEREVWIDETIPETERGFILLHELHEWNQMSGGTKYNLAHTESSRLEYRCRHHPDELSDCLSREGWM